MPTNWTKQQSEVIRSRVGSTVVIAAPGSGKTSVLTEHIVKAVHHDGISPEHIMAVTFTRQAALHMRHKLKQHPAMSFRSSETLRIGTFHAQMFRALLEVNANIPVLMNGTEQFKLMGEAIATVYGSLHRITHREIVEHLTTYSRTIGNGHGPPTRRLRRVYQLYEKLKVKLHRWDYDDILLSALEVIKRAQVLPYFDGLEYLLVDEFQDTNDVQWGIVNALHRRFGLPVFVVGDDDQSIYGFRGASPKYLQQGTATFSNAKQYLLTFNFRSDRKIVSHADTFIRHLNDRIEKPLQATSNAAGFVQAYGVTNTLVQTTVVSDILQGIIENSSASVSVAVLARNRRQLYEAWRRYRERVQSGGSPTNRVDVEFRTFHDSKGKEWDVVILLHLSVTHDRDFMSGTDSERRNEERRLFYVAMTRAKFALILFVPFERDGVRTAPLAFLQEANIKITAWDAKDVHRIRETLDR